MKYKVGNKVKIREDLDVSKMYGNWDCSYDMASCCGMIATIVRCNDNSNSYIIDVDDGFYNWSDEMFEDYLSNDEDNKIENHRFKYVIGYHRYENKLETFNGFIENFYPSGKSCFIDENGKILLLPYDRIEFIIPHEVD